MLGFGTNANKTEWQRRKIGPLYGTGGMVATGHPLMTTTGLDVLQRGGNAVDAAVAAGITGSVVMPEMCGLGGDLFALVYDPKTNQTLSFLGSGISPKRATIEQMRAAGDGRMMPYRGPNAVGVPGMVDGYFTLLKHFGTRAFAELAEPAIGYAGNGFPLTHDLAGYMAEYASLFREFPSSEAIFLPGGTSKRAGEIFKQTDLAATLRTIGEKGGDVFYKGDIGQRIVKAMQADGSAMDLDDFAGHRTVVEAPLKSTYRGYTTYQTGLPTQGLIMLELLNILEASGPAPETPDAAWVHRMVESKKLAYADRLGYALDPLFGETPMEKLLSPEWAARRARQINPERAATDVPAGDMKDGDTTYFCVVDGDGMMVSLIQSVSAAFGCGFVAGDTGVVLNNRVGRGFSLDDGHPNIFAPGKRTMHTLNCFLIGDEQGTPILVGGTPGGDGQPQWNAQFISEVVDFGQDVQAAIEAPRWTNFPGTDPSTLPGAFELRIEDRAGDAVISGLEQRGHTVKRVPAWAKNGSFQAIARDPNSGVLAGGTDPRVEGTVAGF